ncbi:hypothetical protein VTN00DRAFT_7162 [Thermoascus crustaceus]|uniref:uncharacterized protein n=1 Tax=Thermoascus crustaceus TaxID=5088 RepID=UPI003742B98F
MEAIKELSHHPHAEGHLERADRLALAEYLQECPAARLPLAQEANGHRLTANPPSWLQRSKSRKLCMVPYMLLSRNLSGEKY